MKFEISEKDFEVVMNALAELPAKMSFNTIVSLQQQIGDMTKQVAEQAEKQKPVK